MSQPSLTEFKSYAFFTLTYDGQHHIPSAYYWQQVATDYNRFIQKLRRLHNSPIQAVRSFESHASGNPHIHVLARFPTVLTIHNGKYFDPLLFKKWKSLWTRGYLDAKVTRTGQTLPLRYLLKYISKHTHTYKTLWRNYFKCSNNVESATQSTSATSQPPKNVETANFTDEKILEELPPKELSTLLFCKSFKIKQLSWTRSFFPAEQKGLSSPRGQTLLTSAYK